MYEHPRGLREVVPNQAGPQKCREFCVQTGGAQSTLQVTCSHYFLLVWLIIFFVAISRLPFLITGMCGQLLSYFSICKLPVLGIRDILLRIRIRGSVPLTN
jgi:hypothetical protein